jgi:hypothetical protein
MSNQYRAVHPSYVAQHGSDVVDLEFGSPADEADALRYFELVPRPYRALTDNYTVDGKPVPQGAVVHLALPIEVEAALISGGHLERCRRDAQPTVELDAGSEELAPKATRKGATPNQNDKE